jgi:hypothetical protein
MAVSGKTKAPYEIPYFLDTDKPPDMAAVTKALADKLDATKWLSRSVGLTVGYKQGTGLVTLSGSLQTAIELSITPEVASKLIVISSLRVL